MTLAHLGLVVLEDLVEALLVLLDGEGVVRLLVADEEPGVVALSVQGVRGDNDTGKVVGLQQGSEAGDFVRLVRDP